MDRKTQGNHYYRLSPLHFLMPVMDGFKATRRIREEEEFYGVHIPIIALTAHTTGGEEANRMIQAGMDFHLTKPLSEQKLLEAIRFIQGK
ncbi:hypothetical protein RJ639_046936 [Escallonia herrerae]|uniref:histidine kinase n=1 Tax=Escallonia herrerae TaxID=1293975 RepID=A0AA88W3Q3_9ASTE|nr:hypothetical protein RJ639_046936 [Escallonia herrerae]